jgi:hypothetical protein
MVFADDSIMARIAAFSGEGSLDQAVTTRASSGLEKSKLGFPI